jgi:hypothetical protein
MSRRRRGSATTTTTKQRLRSARRVVSTSQVISILRQNDRGPVKTDPSSSCVARALAGVGSPPGFTRGVSTSYFAFITLSNGTPRAPHVRVDISCSSLLAARPIESPARQPPVDCRHDRPNSRPVDACADGRHPMASRSPRDQCAECDEAALNIRNMEGPSLLRSSARAGLALVQHDGGLRRKDDFLIRLDQREAAQGGVRGEYCRRRKLRNGHGLVGGDVTRKSER